MSLLLVRLLHLFGSDCGTLEMYCWNVLFGAKIALRSFSSYTAEVDHEKLTSQPDSTLPSDRCHWVASCWSSSHWAGLSPPNRWILSCSQSRCVWCCSGPGNHTKSFYSCHVVAFSFLGPKSHAIESVESQDTETWMERIRKPAFKTRQWGSLVMK